ncbi:SGNH/GDSL hydrolase family protein [Shimia sp. R11_0]|uniref:SGNH/GDSL hydrolase family protein n=1 Tax=Shimia sp. R11_0 TaxID=2821096 RepID=UPI001FFDECC9|nr:SGNH/GDSL hydrolase family protein [Shimia sp. R11_0]
MKASFLVSSLVGAALALLSGCSEVDPSPDGATVSASVDRSTSADASDAKDVVSKSTVSSAPASPRIMAMGDSMMAWHALTQASVSHAIEDALDEPVSSYAVSGARVLYSLPVTGALGLRISSQYRKGDWDWIVLNGGGNDLWLGCGCGACTRTMEKLISEDGKRGAIPEMVQRLRATGAQVAYVGYLRSPGVWSPIEGCRDNGAVLEERITRLAELDWGVHFVSLQDLVPEGDRSFHGVDMIHPSLKGSREIGKRVAAVISTNDQGR